MHNEYVAFQLFYQKMLGRGKNEKKRAVPAGRRVPSKEGDALRDVLPFSTDSSTGCPCVLSGHQPLWGLRRILSGALLSTTSDVPRQIALNTSLTRFM